MATKNNISGSAWKFPIAFDTLEREPIMANTDTAIVQSIRLLLGTRRGERPMNPFLGNDIQELLFQHPDATTLKEIELLLRHTLIRYEPRIDVEKITVDSTGMEVGQLLFRIQYTVRITNSRHNKVFPFYIKEGSLLNP